jgi:hypothetical protein
MLKIPENIDFEVLELLEEADWPWTRDTVLSDKPRASPTT